MSTCFYTNVNAWVYTCGVSALVFLRFLHVMFNRCVGNNSPIPQGMKQARKRPGPQTSRDPQGTGPPGEPRRDTAASTRKGQRRARRRDLWQPQCRRPRVPWRQARRLHRQSTTPGPTISLFWSPLTVEVLMMDPMQSGSKFTWSNPVYTVYKWSARGM